MSLERAHSLWLAIVLSLLLSAACTPGEQAEPVTLRLEVSLTPQELETFQPAIEALDEAHPEWEIVLETTPQSGVVEKINTQLAGNSLPDVVRVQGLFAQQWIRQNAFLDLADRLDDQMDLDDFYAGPLEQFYWQDKLWGLPDTAAPDVVYYNKAMFDAAGLAYPTDAWTYDDMRQAAIQLTLDAEGRNPTDPDFDPDSIQQWGWNGGFSIFWQRHLVRPFGGELCANEDCTLMTFTSPETVAAAGWWAVLRPARITPRSTIPTAARRPACPAIPLSPARRPWATMAFSPWANSTTPAALPMTSCSRWSARTASATRR